MCNPSPNPTRNPSLSRVTPTLTPLATLALTHHLPSRVSPPPPVRFLRGLGFRLLLAVYCAGERKPHARPWPQRLFRALPASGSPLGPPRRPRVWPAQEGRMRLGDAGFAQLTVRNARKSRGKSGRGENLKNPDEKINKK